MAKKTDVTRKCKENATKFIQKGDYAKALEQYRALAKLEPTDLRFRMKVGECLSKLNKKKEAVLEYNEIAKQYMKDGFLIQAIAICKLIIQLDPAETEAQNILAELNSRRGIVVGKKPQARPALSLKGISGPIPSAVKPTEEASEPEAAPAPEEEPAPPPEPEEEAAAPAEEEVAAPPAEWPAPEEEAPPVEEEASPAEETAPPADEEAAPALVEDEEAAPEIAAPAAPEEKLPAGTEAEPIPLEEAPENMEEEPAEEAPGPSEYPPFPEIPLFSDLNVEEFKRVVAKFQIGTLPKSITVIKEGSRGDSFFIIAGGKVRVYKWSANQKRKMTLAVLEEGSFFGEFAFLTNSTRSASIETLEECVLLRINRKDLEEIIKAFPHVQKVINDFYKKRVLDTLLTISPLFQSLADDERSDVISRFENVELDTGDVIIREGEEGKALYVIKHGSIEVSVKRPGTAEKLVVATLREGDFFGEISLLQHKPTTATCTAQVPTSMFRLPKAAFNELIMIHPQMLETMSTTVDERLKSTTKSLTARKEDRQSEGLV